MPGSINLQAAALRAWARVQRVHRRCARLAMVCTLVALGRSAKAQELPPAPSGQSRRVEGRVVRGAATGEQPVGSQTVVLHRIGADSAGPMDSARTTHDGRYRFTFRDTGDDAMYIVSSRYGGVTYFTPPLRGGLVSGSDAEVVVFDTTSREIPLGVRGRHLVLSAPGRGGARRVVEVFEVSNDTSVTRIAGPSGTATWSVVLPERARGAKVEQGDVPSGAVRFEKGHALVFAPFPPGIKQIVLSYELPASAFPLIIPAVGAGVLEVLLEESAARADAIGLQRQAPVTLEGRSFQRYLAQDPSSSALHVIVPSSAWRRHWMPLTAMALAGFAFTLGIAVGRRRGSVPGGTLAVAGAPDAIALANAIAALDAVHEARSDHGDDTRAAYQTRRAELKAALVAALPPVEPPPASR